LFDREPISPSVPIACRTAAARSGGQGRPPGRRAPARLALDGREPGGTLTVIGTGVRSVVAVAVLMLSGGISVAAGAQPVGVAVVQPAPVSPVDAAIAEASRRFGVPESWIGAVMRVESAGEPSAVSRAGAMGLMQVMPGTYAELRARHALGPDPFDIRDVMAGTAYLREMFDRYGPRGMLASYNAGPGRWEAYLAGRQSLPAETVGYLAKLGPAIDPAAVNAPPLTVTPAAPSPFAAPIFVALTSRSAVQRGSEALPDLRQVIAANTTIVPSGGELFVRRATASDVPAGLQSDNAAIAAPPHQGAEIITPDVAADRPANPLFPSRSSDMRR